MEAVNAANMYQFKAKDSEIKYYTLYWGNILKYFTIINMKKKKQKKTGLKGSLKLFFCSF